MSDDLTDHYEELSLDRDENGREPDDLPVTPWGEALDAALMAEDAPTCARHVARLHAIDAQVKRAIRDAEEHLLACLEGKRQLITDDFRVEVDLSRPRKSWRWDELFRSLLPKVRDVPRLLHDSGEVEDDTARAVRVLRECLSISSGKVTGLRNVGLDPDEFCEAGAPVERVRVTWTGEPW